jgi:hypothetical protein
MQFTDQICAILVAICATIPVAILGLLLGRAYRDGQRVRIIVYGLTFIHETALVALPGWYSCLTAFQLEAAIGVTPEQLVTVYGGEALFVTLFGLVLLLAGKRPRAQRRESSESRSLSERYVLYGLVIAAAILYVGRLFSPVFTAQDVATNYQIVAQTSLWDSAISWAITLIQWPGLVAAALLAADKATPRAMRLLGAAVLLGQLVYAMLHGYRGGVVWVVSMIVIGGFYENRKRLLIAAGALTLFLVPLFPWLHSTMRYASLAAPAGTSGTEMIPFLISGITDPNTLSGGKDTDDSFLDSWANRAEGPRNSTALYGLYDQGDGAYYKPILGAVILPVPRMWWVDKPVAGSTDTTNLGAAIYRVQQGKPGNAFYDMGPILSSAHAYWEGGWLFLVAAPLLSAWMWRWLLAWGERAGQRLVDVIVLTFLTALPIDGFFGAINPVFAYVRIFWITLLPLGLLAIGLNSLIKKRRLAATRRRATAPWNAAARGVNA